MNPVIIAIDGEASTGKSTQAKKIAENRIIAMMNENPPRATQADLDKVRAIKVN